DSGDAIDVAERTPALNDNGDVAFVSSVVDPTGNSTALNWAIFLHRAGQGLTTVYKRNDPFPDVGGKFDVLGPPALNVAGTLAFHALVNIPGKSDPLDGVFKLEGGTLSLLIREGAVLNPLTPATFQIDPIAGYDDVVVLNDQGDVACTGGPLFDNSAN